MSSRIDELWPHIKKVYRRTGRAGNPSSRTSRSTVPSKSADITSIVSLGKQSQVSNTAPSQPHYIDAPSRIIWDALVEMLVDIVTYTATSDAIFDDIVEILAPIIASRGDVRNALERRNADAVWLALFRLEMKSKVPSAINVIKMRVPKVMDPGSRCRWAALR